MTLKDIALKHMLGWPLYNDKHEISTRDISGGVWLGYRTSPNHQPRDTTHFDVNILKGVFYVLEIRVEPQHRGKGHGDALYKVLEAIAKDAGCHKVQMTASGWTHTGEARKDYLLRRGYEEFNVIEVVKEL